jgi:hypothetical protein
MWEVIKYCLIYIILSLFTKCNSNFDFKEIEEISSSIEEAQEKKVFISEYRIETIHKKDTAFDFPIEEIWVERKWYLTLDSNDKRSHRIDTNKLQISVRLKKGNELSGNNFFEKWMLWDKDSSSILLTRNRISLQPKVRSIPDSIFATIYILSSPYALKKNLIEVSSFIAVRKQVN